MVATSKLATGLGKTIMGTLDYVFTRYYLDKNQEMPIFIPDCNRNRLSKLFIELDFKLGVEIGVAEGLFSKILLFKSPRLTLYGIDSWTSYPEYSDTPQSSFDEAEVKARTLLNRYEKCNIVKKFSMDAVKDFDDESLDFVYIDANHAYNYVLEDITEWYKKVKNGGIVSGHDYDFADVKNALDKFIKDNNIDNCFVFGRNEKVAGEIRENQRSWFFVK